ncbi:hypothetical protein ACH4MN_18080 [Streptomyces anulatus]
MPWSPAGAAAARDIAGEASNSAWTADSTGAATTAGVEVSSSREACFLDLAKDLVQTSPFR